MSKAPRKTKSPRAVAVTPWLKRGLVAFASPSGMLELCANIVRHLWKLPKDTPEIRLRAYTVLPLAASVALTLKTTGSPFKRVVGAIATFTWYEGILWCRGHRRNPRNMLCHILRDKWIRDHPRLKRLLAGGKPLRLWVTCETRKPKEVGDAQAE